VTVTVKIVDEPIIHVVRYAELFEFVQHRGMTNCVERFTKIEGNDVRVVGKHGGYSVEEVDDGGSIGPVGRNANWSLNVRFCGGLYGRWDI